MEIYNFSVRTGKRTELINITKTIEDFIFKSSNPAGLCFVYSPHTTTGIIINEAYDPDVAFDINLFLNNLAPKNNNYRHAEGNSDAHIKAAIIGNSRMTPYSGNKLNLGRWEGIFLCEFDGPRQRNINLILI
ncbi:MAG: secondary thiamine-phosphate synthase enzyme YjbQ [Deltaproteobacteria bacterium]|jgi:secondary thiamine-phosphate synthase enzyme|nr:secondary thiamine-phosphate synthase enzyme YjbQ [Deltaproteobacteria bacterium]